MRSLYIPVVINDPPPGRSVISQPVPHVDAIGCTSARQFLWTSLVQSPQYFRCHNIFHFSLHCRNITIIISFTHVHEYPEKHHLRCV